MKILISTFMLFHLVLASEDVIKSSTPKLRKTGDEHIGRDSQLSGHVEKGFGEDSDLKRDSERNLETAKPCNVDKPHWLGDGYCNKSGGYNTEECGWDEGDCCQETCVETCKHKCTASFDCKSLKTHIVNKHDVADAIINAVEDDQKWAIWNIFFFGEEGIFPTIRLEFAMLKVYQNLRETGKWDEMKKKVEGVGNVEDPTVINKSLDLIIAREVMKAAIEGRNDALLDKIATPVASQNELEAFLSTASAVEENVRIISLLATYLLLEVIGITSPEVIDHSTWLVMQTIVKLFGTKKGPNDNWCYIVKASEVHDVWLKTYKAYDRKRWIPYWKAYSGDFTLKKVMSAGQQQDESFQLDVGKAYFEKVYYQDYIFLGKDTCGTNYACQCGGVNNKGFEGRCLCKNTEICC